MKLFMTMNEDMFAGSYTYRIHTLAHCKQAFPMVCEISSDFEATQGAAESGAAMLARG